jgi:hypothetical protein
MTRSNTSRSRAWLLPILLGSLLLVWAAAVSGARPADAQPAPTNPALSRLEVDVWPEFDQASKVLVIMRLEIAPDVTLPAEATLRIPAASGGPTAVATAVTASSALQNLNYKTKDRQVDFMTIGFTAANRFVHIEFYEPVATSTPERSYRYMWAGDFPVAQTVVQLQEPATSSDVAVTPDLGTGTTQTDGLTYREAELGPLEAGSSLTVEVQYSKSDLRTTAEILGLVQVTPASQGGGGSDDSSDTILILVGAGAVAAIVAIAALFAWRRLSLVAGQTVPASRGERRRSAAAGNAWCSQCGAKLGEDAHFCASCGHPVKSKR